MRPDDLGVAIRRNYSSLMLFAAAASLTTQGQRLKRSAKSGHGAALWVVRGDTKEKRGTMEVSGRVLARMGRQSALQTLWLSAVFRSFIACP